jgi:selenocysteine lyase/cysteine desulfurase
MRPALQESLGNGAPEESRVGRRTLLGVGAMSGLGLALGACTSGGDDDEPSGAASATASADFDPQSWDSVRAQFALDPDLAHFAAFVLASHPASVARAIDEHRKGLDGDTEGYLDASNRLESAVRSAAAAYLDVPAREVALTDSTTMGLGLLYGGLRLRPGDEVLTTTHDFYSTTESLALAARRTDAEISHVTLYHDPATADPDEIVGRLAAGITPRTRVVAITWVHSGTGVRLPVRAIADAVAAANEGRSDEERALLCVDGVHGFGLIAQSVADLGCDFLSAGTHKWLMGPRGTGLLWGRAWDRVETSIPTFSAPHFAPGPLATPGGFHSFEHRWAVPEAFAFHNSIGSGRIEERTVGQATQLKEGLAEIRGVRVVTPMSPDLSAGIVCLAIDGIEPWDAVPALREDHRVIASVTPYDNPYLRLGPSIVTTPEEVDRVIAAVAALA